MKPTERYYAHSLTRGRRRRNAKKKYAALIEKNRNARILVVLHLFYEKSWVEIKEYLKNLEEYSWDFYVTVTKGRISERTLSDIKRFRPYVHIVLCENAGYDIAPFLTVLKQIDLKRYDMVFKLQSKGTKRRWIYIYNRLFFRRDWFLQLYDGILSAENVHETIEKLNQKPAVGMAAAGRLIVEDPSYKQQLIRQIAAAKGIEIPKQYRFVAGTCFAVRADCLRPVKELAYAREDFTACEVGGGLSYAHFLERYFCMAVTEGGYEISGNPVHDPKDFAVQRLERFLARFTVQRLLELEPDIAPEWIFGHLDNRLMRVTKRHLALSELRIQQKASDRAVPIEASDLYSSFGRDEVLDGSCPILIDERKRILCGQETACLLYKARGGAFLAEAVQVKLLNPKSRIKAMLPASWKRLLRIGEKDNR